MMKYFQSKEFIRYILGGLSITLLNGVIYTGLFMFGIKPRWANLTALISAKIYGYFINKFFVYQKTGLTPDETGKEFIKYFISRGITGILDFVLVLILVEWYGFHALITKYAVMVLVVLFNYVSGKFWVFKSGENDETN